MEQEREGQEAEQEGEVAAPLDPTGGSGASVASQSLSYPAAFVLHTVSP